MDTLISEYPEADTMLKYNTTFELLVAVILSAQSTDAQVNRVTGELFKKYNSPLEFAALGQPELEQLIKGAGLYRNKAKNIKAMAEKIIKEFNGQVPDNFDDLLTLPGVGRKTANVMLAVGFNQAGLGVDTHVHRVANRLGLATSKNPDQTERQLKELIPRELWSKTHHLLIWHGRRICKARNPGCAKCILNSQCITFSGVPSR